MSVTSHSTPPRSQRQTRVIYLGGVGRSGSSLLARLLDAEPDTTAVGEVVRLWERGIADDERCSCGRRFSECDFWRRVGAAGFGGWERVDVDRVEHLRVQVGRLRHVPRLTAPWQPRSRGGHGRLARAYAGYYARVYDAVRRVSGCRAVVDGSKNISLAAVLRLAPEVDLRVVHLVRDVPAVAYSWGKRVRRPETDGSTLMPTYLPTLVGLWWITENALFHALGRRGVPVLRLRYEDLVADPSGTLDAVRRFADLDEVPGYPFLDGRRARLGRGHTFGGNPMRFVSEPVELGLDDAWRAELGRRARWVVSALGLPLRLGYGYLGRGR
ncbi:MAG: sulfotransferase [Carbonactinosporaceae bacterium]